MQPSAPFASMAPAQAATPVAAPARTIGVADGFPLATTPARLAQRHAALKKSTVRLVIFAVIFTAVGIGWLYVGLTSFGWSLDVPGILALRLPSVAMALLLCWTIVSGWVQVARVAMLRHDHSRALARLAPGPAVVFRRDGLLLAHPGFQEFLAWDQVRAVRGVAQRGMPGPEMRVERVDGSHWSVPFVLLELMPGTVDSAVWSFSGRRIHLDMSACEQVW